MIKTNQKEIENALKSNIRTYGRANVGKAATRAVNHTIVKARTQARIEIKKTYQIKVADINKAMAIRKGRGEFGEATLNLKGKGLPLSYFNAVENRDKAEVTFTIKKRRKERIRGAFVTTTKNSGEARKDKKGVFIRGRYTNTGLYFRRKRVRLDDNDLPITELRTTSVASMFDDPAVYKAATDAMRRDLMNRFDHELKRL